jgi:dienelactone hydrolase
MKKPLLFICAIVMLHSCSQNIASSEKTGSPDTAIKPVTREPKQILPLQVTFTAADGLIITADSYYQSDTLPWLLLCHQAGYSRGEYKETAQKFLAQGFNCLAIDQRSGNEVNGIVNETAARAKQQGKQTGYLDAEQDIIAAVNYLFENSKQPVVLVGSSYSAGLVLKIAVNNPKVKAVLAFSPGEYYGDKLHLAESIKTLDKPVFITSARQETMDAKIIFAAIASEHKTFFAPVSPGAHASSCLWESTDDYQEYWKAVNAFMEGIK